MQKLEKAWVSSEYQSWVTFFEETTGNDTKLGMCEMIYLIHENTRVACVTWCIHCNVCYLGHLGLLSKPWEIVIFAPNIVTNYKIIWLLKKDDLMMLNQFKTKSINLKAQHMNGMTHFYLAVQNGKLTRIHVRLLDWLQFCDKLNFHASY